MFSANVALEDETADPSRTPETGGKGTWAMIPIAFAIAIGVFFVGPLFVVDRIEFESSVISAIVEGLIRLGFFIVYLLLISQMPDMKRVFAYHGAEHMTIAAHEHGEALEIADIRKYPKEHPRCGTAFLLTVVVVAVVLFALIGIADPNIWLLILSRVVLIPVIASVSYEVIRFNAAHEESLIGRIGMAPGLWLQLLTTRKPDDSQIEIAVTAMKVALKADGELIPEMPKSVVVP